MINTTMQFYIPKDEKKNTDLFNQSYIAKKLSTFVIIERQANIKLTGF